MLTRVLRFTLNGLIIASLTGCAINKSIDNAANSIRDAAAILGQSLQEGAKNIDPVAVKRLLDENEKLRLELLKIEEKTQQFGESVGVIQLSGARLLLRVESYRGDCAVYAYIDDRTDWIWNPLSLDEKAAVRIDPNTDFPVTLDEGYREYLSYASLPYDINHTASNTAGTVSFIILNYVKPAFKKFVMATAHAASQSEIDLQNQVPPGKHWLTIELVPKANEPHTADWSAKIRLVQQFPDRSEQTLRSGEWSSALDPTFQFGKPLDRKMVLPLLVTASSH